MNRYLSLQHMLNHRVKFKAFRWYKLVFQLVFWGMWLVFPAIMISNMVDSGQLPWKFIISGISLIPLFYLNANYLIPIILEKKGIAQYLVFLFLATLFFYIINYFIDTSIFFDSLFGTEFRRPRGPGGVEGLFRPRRFLRSLFPVLTILAVSTVFGFVNYFIRSEQRKQEENQERQRAELTLLRSQVSPHFLFNTLNSVLYLIRVKSPRAEELVLKLSDILKYMIYESRNNEVLLNLEIEYLNNYIELQSIRFGDDIGIHYQVKGDFNHYLIEPMLIIPFVENAFKHGTSVSEDPEIHISIEMKDHEMELMVKNKFQETDMKNDVHSGIGLENVEKRLALLYPESHELLVTKTEGWYIVNLTIKLSANE